MLVNAKVKDPIRSEQEAIDFLTDLVNRIDMKIIKGPFAHYLDIEGNRGLTAIVMIETSHIAFHIWDEEDPGMLQFDLYTCGSLDKFTVLNALNERFNIDSIDWVVYDRENGFVVEDIYESQKRKK
jgi:S-adenosylmethionine/arginine decarboxylase-like enzyme